MMQNRTRKDCRVSRRQVLKLFGMTLFLSSCKQARGMPQTLAPGSTPSPEPTGVEDDPFALLGPMSTLAPTPTLGPPLQGFPSTHKTIAAGQNHTLAIRLDGTLWAWGNNEFGQLGNGTGQNSTLPVHISGIESAVSVDAGDNHSVALLADGTVWTWGFNNSRQLGDGTEIDRAVPMQVGLENVTAIAAGTKFTMALKNDGTVWGWGQNISGQLGNGDYDWNSKPTQSLMADAVAVTAGSYHCLGIKTDGSLWAWGDNILSQLGLGNAILRETTEPVYIPYPDRIIAVAAGSAHNLVLRDDGTVWAWGLNYNGQLGRPNVERSATPTQQVQGLGNIIAITALGDHSLALGDDGTVWGWGDNLAGQVGIAAHRVFEPRKILSLTDVVEIECGFEYSVARLPDGTIWAWGDNEYGQLGDGTTRSTSSPVQVAWPD